MTPRVVIVGGGPAAERCAFALRSRGFDGTITMIAAESVPPYDRTLVSKDVLSDEPPSPADALLQPEAAYEDAAVDLRLGISATGLDWRGRRLLLDDGPAERYDALVIATGASPWCPPALAAPGVMTVRSLDDGERLARTLLPGRRLAIVGGGFIGGEVASAACARGVDVTILEAREAPLAGVVGAEVGGRIAALHVAHGVTVLTGTSVERVRQVDAGYELRLTDGGRLHADEVVVGIGVRPAVEWLGSAPIVAGRAVPTDSNCKTVLPNVVAAGDCARWMHRGYEEHVRVEHWDTARRHGEAAAASVIGDGKPFTPLPFFWSDQHGVKLQLVGRTDDCDLIEVEDVDPPRKFVARYFKRGVLTAVLAAGLPRVVAGARKTLLTPKTKHEVSI